MPRKNYKPIVPADLEVLTSGEKTKKRIYAEGVFDKKKNDPRVHPEFRASELLKINKLNEEPRDFKKNRCEMVMADWSQCPSGKQTGYQWCYFHNPAITQEQKNEDMRKGKARKKLEREYFENPPAPSINSKEDLLNYALEIAHLVRLGKMDLKEAAMIKDLLALAQKNLPENIAVDSNDPALRLKGQIEAWQEKLRRQKAGKSSA